MFCELPMSDSTSNLLPGISSHFAGGSGQFHAEDDPELAEGTDAGEPMQHLAPLEEAALAHQLASLCDQPNALRLPPGLPLHVCFEKALKSLYLSFQPIVRADGSTFGHEALLRPNCAILKGPLAMLDAADQLGRSEQLGRIIRLRAAETYLAARPPEHLQLFVNLNAADLADRSLLSRFAPLTQIARRVVLEITERASLEHVEDIRERVADLRQMGFQIAIDDLGAGHNRMRLLNPVDTDFVKLDMNLVRDIDTSGAKQSLVRSIIDRCHAHGIAVIGEGVESQLEAVTLREIGCDLLQGYLFGHPAPVLQ